ncbi:putative transporter svop-1 [Thrips palmi]|uniref:Transporter svop-1 n=1 Tax=Thrips palmi TaxID=161013 RepID=A0A6P8ZC85_THRPL|nr:putative transporter svop-1 [Thrips palmi]
MVAPVGPVSEPQAATKLKTVTIDEAIQATGVGLYHWLLVVATGMCSASAVGEIVSMSYVLSPAAWMACDLSMNLSDKVLLSSIVFIGMLMGTHLWGVTADSWGRLPLLRLTLLLDAVVGVISSLLPDKRLFIAARFFNGFLVAGPTSTAMAYLGEFHTEKTRAKAMIILGLFPGGWTLFVAMLAYLVLPLDIAWELPSFYGEGALYRPWRLYILLNSMPALLTGLSFLLFPESPRFLVATGRPQKALDALRTVHAFNKGRKKEFPVGALVASLDGPQSGGKLMAMWNQTAPLFGREHLKNTALVCAVLFALVSSANGLLVWMPEIFNRMALFLVEQPDVEVTACQAIDYMQELRSNITAAVSEAGQESLPLQCGGELPASMFFNTGVIGVSNVALGFLSSFFVNWMGKRNMLAGILVLSGVCALLLTVVPSSLAMLVLACGTISLSSTGVSIIVALACENYPTTLRATAVSLSMLAGRCGSMSGSLLFGALLDTQCNSAFWGFGALLAVCGVLSFLLPRRGKYAT